MILIYKKLKRGEKSLIIYILFKVNKIASITHSFVKIISLFIIDEKKNLTINTGHIANSSDPNCLVEISSLNEY